MGGICSSLTQLNMMVKRAVLVAVAAKHRETKQHFALYNTLCDVKQFMEKEISQLSSIHDNFALAMSSNCENDYIYIYIKTAEREFLYVCMYLCMYVFMYVSKWIYIYIFLRIQSAKVCIQHFCCSELCH